MGEWHVHIHINTSLYLYLHINLERYKDPYGPFLSHFPPIFVAIFSNSEKPDLHQPQHIYLQD